MINDFMSLAAGKWLLPIMDSASCVCVWCEGVNVAVVCVCVCVCVCVWERENV